MGGEYCNIPSLFVPSARLLSWGVSHTAPFLLSLPFQFIYAAVRSFPIFIVSMSFPCFGCFCSGHQGQAFLPLIAHPPAVQLFSASPAFSPLDPQRPSVPVRPGSSQCSSPHVALLPCWKHSPSTALSEASQGPALSCEALFLSSAFTVPIALSCSFFQ